MGFAIATSLSAMFRSEVRGTSVFTVHTTCFTAFFEDISPLCKATDPLFRTWSEVYLGFQRQMGESFHGR